ncbi:hypothetical protein BKA62DRAFT_684807 [Auriculariales sp. MPI-PUGE-AT-0066]|nr:hypothetical protein BKA62DRAFT_684807 [Auriculariales sp. MPI-PUGE-AT-0066]
MVVHICSMLSLADRITMCSVSRAWRSFLLTAPTVWSEGDIGTFSDLRWVAKYHQHTPLRLRSFIPLHQLGPLHHQAVSGPSALPNLIGPKYPNGHWMTYDLHSKLAPHIQRCLLLGGQLLKSSTYTFQHMGTRQIVLPTDMAERFPVLRTLYLPPCTISSDMMQMRSLEKLVATLHLGSPGVIPEQMVTQLLQKLPSLRHLELIGVSNAVVPTLSACKPPATLRILKLSSFFRNIPVVGPREHIDYSPLLQSEGWRSLKLDKISLFAAVFAGTAVDEFKMLVSSTTISDIALCVSAHAVDLPVASERDFAISYGITEYGLPGISNPVDRDILSIRVPIYARTQPVLHPHMQPQQMQQQQMQQQMQQQQMQLQQQHQQMQLHQHQQHQQQQMQLHQHQQQQMQLHQHQQQQQQQLLQIQMQQQLGPMQLLQQAIPPTNNELFRLLFGEIADISPAVISRITRIELSGFALNALLIAQLSLPVVTILRLVITCERDGSACFGNGKDPDTSVELPSAGLSLPHLRTVHAECAQYLFTVPKPPPITPQSSQPISNHNMTQMQVPYLQMRAAQAEAQMRLMQARLHPSSTHSIPVAPALPIGLLEERSRHRAHVLERWFVRLLPGLVRGYGRALDTITVRLPSWKGFEAAAEEFDLLFAGLALNRAVVREPDGVLYEDPYSGPKAAAFQT